MSGEMIYCSSPVTASFVAAALVQARLSAGLTQQALSHALGVSRRWVQLREQGIAAVPLTDFIRWCHACQLKPDEVLEWIISHANQS